MKTFFALLVIFAPATYAGDIPNLPPGTVLLSTNLDESLNTSPGELNHASIIGAHGEIIESQATKMEHGNGPGVIRTSIADYAARKYAPPIILYPRDERLGAKAAAKAETLVGLPYRKASSVLPKDRRPERGLNCVSVVRIAYTGATGKRVRIRKPDDILRMPELTKNKPKPARAA